MTLFGGKILFKDHGYSGLESPKVAVTVFHVQCFVSETKQMFYKKVIMKVTNF